MSPQAIDGSIVHPSVPQVVDQFGKVLANDDLVQQANHAEIKGRIRAITADGWVSFVNFETGNPHMLRGDELVLL